MTGRIDLCAASYGLACGPRPVCLGARQLVLNAVKHGSTSCTTGCSSGFALCLRRRRAGQSVARWRAEKLGATWSNVVVWLCLLAEESAA